MTDITWTLISAALYVWCLLTQPISWRASPGRYIDGCGTGEIRPRGEFALRPVPGGDPDADGTYQHPDVTPDDNRRLVGRIACVGAIQVTADHVRCLDIATTTRAAKSSISDAVSGERLMTMRSRASGQGATKSLAQDEIGAHQRCGAAEHSGHRGRTELGSDWNRISR